MSKKSDFFGNISRLPASLSCDVVIVGYGPVGITFAALLAKAGHKVIVVERFPQRYDKPRAGHFDGETMRTFQHLGIAKDIELLVRKMNSYEVISSTSEVLTALKQGDAGSGWHKSYLFHQPEVEDVIDERGRGLGVRVLMNTTAVDITQGPDGAQLVVRDSDVENGPNCTIEASYIIGADGANSFVRQKIGAEKRDLGFPPIEDLAIDFEYHDPDIDVPLGESGHIVDDGHVVTFGRWTGGRISRVEVCKLEGESREYLEREETAWKFLNHFGLTPELGRIIRHSIYEIECSITSPWRSGRIFLMGDAAHRTVPFLGQGMVAGIRDAFNLAWKLDSVLRKRAAPTLLDSYESERSPQAVGVIGMAMAVGKTVMPAAAKEAEQERQGLKAGGEPTTIMAFPRIGEGIVRSANHPNGTPSDGRPALQARVALNGKVDLLEEFINCGWRIVSRHAVTDNMLNDEQRSLLVELSMERVHVSRASGSGHFIDLDGDYETWFQATGQKAFVIRPDHYVFGGAATMAEIPALLDELKATLVSNGWTFN